MGKGEQLDLPLPLQYAPPRYTIDDLNWEVIHWAQSKIADTVCAWSSCAKRLNVRETREGCYCLDCWLRMPRCRDCGKVAAQKTIDKRAHQCRDCFVPTDDEGDLFERANEILYNNTTWTDVVRDSGKKEGS